MNSSYRSTLNSNTGILLCRTEVTNGNQNSSSGGCLQYINHQQYCATHSEQSPRWLTISYISLRVHPWQQQDVRRAWWLTTSNNSYREHSKQQPFWLTTSNSSYQLKKPLWTAALVADYLEQLDRTLQTTTFWLTTSNSIYRRPSGISSDYWQPLTAVVMDTPNSGPAGWLSWTAAKENTLDSSPGGWLPKKSGY